MGTTELENVRAATSSEIPDDFELEITTSGEVIARWKSGQRTRDKKKGHLSQLAPDERDELQEEIARLRSGALDGQVKEIRALGLKLYRAIFADDVKALFERAVDDVILTQHRRMRITVDAAGSDAADWPFEFVFSPQMGTFLGTRQSIALYRKIEIQGPVEPDTPPLRVLVVMSLPKQCGKVDPPAGVLTTLLELVSGGKTLTPRLEVKVLGWPPGSDIAGVDLLDRWATWSNLMALTDPAGEDGEPWRPHVLHFIGHGQVKATVSYLGLADEDHPLDRVFWCDGETVAQLFRSLEPRVVILQACENAHEGTEQAFLSLVTKLIGFDSNVPTQAIVATWARFGNEYASQFAHGFYEALTQGKTLDEAVQQGRRELGVPKQWGDHHFGSPVLFTSDPVGIIQIGSGDARAGTSTGTIEKTVISPRGGTPERSAQPAKVIEPIRSALEQVTSDQPDPVLIQTCVQCARVFCMGPFRVVANYLDYEKDYKLYLEQPPLSKEDRDCLLKHLHAALTAAEQIAASMGGAGRGGEEQKAQPTGAEEPKTIGLQRSLVGRRPEDVKQEAFRGVAPATVRGSA